jgi:hypothetical protein
VIELAMFASCPSGMCLDEIVTLAGAIESELNSLSPMSDCVSWNIHAFFKINYTRASAPFPRMFLLSKANIIIDVTVGIDHVLL